MLGGVSAGLRRIRFSFMTRFFTHIPSVSDQPIPFVGLYIDLDNNGQYPSVLTISRSLQDFDALVREVTFFADPSFQFDLKLADVKEGSLKFDAFVWSAKKKLIERGRWLTIAAFVSGWLGNEIASHLAQNALQKLLSSEEQSLSEEEAQQLLELFENLKNSRVGEDQAKNLIENLSEDNSVKGAAIIEERGRTPARIFSIQELSQGLPSKILSRDTDQRVRQKSEDLILVAPTLLDKRRKWRFIGQSGEFGAYIEDEEFLQSALSGELGVTIAQGIIVHATVNYLDYFQDGVWVTKDARIAKVHNVTQRPTQDSLFFGSEEHE